jgi:signal peptidase I
VEPDSVVVERSTERWSALGGVLLSALYLWIVVWLALAVVVPAVAFGWQPLAIVSGSMSPTIRVGDVVLSAEADHPLRPGNVITFADPTRDGQLVTHRIVAVDDEGAYRTRGDANASADSALVRPEDVVGQGRVLVPMVGLPTIWGAEQPWLLGLAGAATLAAALVVLGPRRRTGRPVADAEQVAA